MKIIIGFLIVLLVFTSVAFAQNCDPYLPCGPLPWSLPSLPDLQSPTPIPTMIFTVIAPTPTPGGTPQPTNTPFVIPTYTPFVDTGTLAGGIATLNAMIGSTDIPITNFSGTPVALSSLNDIAANTGTAFGYIRGLAEVNFGPLTPLVIFGFTSLFVFFFVNVAGFLIPLIAAVFGVIRKIIELILGFMPF